MPPLGSAPRRVSPGVWKTRTGRTLTAAGAKYWENQFKAGRTDGKGHFDRAKPAPVGKVYEDGSYGVKGGRVYDPDTGKTRKPIPFRSAGVGGGSSAKTRVTKKPPAKGPGAKMLNRAKTREEQGIRSSFFGGLGEAAQAAGRVAYEGSVVAPVVHAVRRPSPRSVVGAVPVTGLNFELGLETAEAARGAGRRALEGQLPTVAQGVALAGLFPFGGRSSRLARAAKKASAAPHPAEVIPDPLAEKGRSAVLDVLTDAGIRYEQIEALRKVDRARKAAMLDRAFREAGGGRAGQQAQRDLLLGEMPALSFDDLAGQLDNETLDAMFNAVQDHRLLLPHEKKNLRTALERLSEGKYIRPFEQTLIRRAFGDDIVIGSAATRRGKLEYMSDIINIPRSLMATGDFSYRLRQGLVALAYEPVGSVKNMGGAFKVTFSQPRFDAMEKALHADPELEEALRGIRGKNGNIEHLQLTDTGHHLPGREEAFQSPAAETITGGRLSPVRAAGRNFTANAILDRAMIYKSLLETARKEGVPIDDHLKWSAIKAANMMTGRSGWGHETFEMLTNTFLFSPKLFKSRLDAINPVFYAQLHPLVRKKVALSMVRIVAAGIGLLAVAAKYGADVELDPRSSDWGKIRVGKTRFDPWAGHQQIARTIAQMAPTRHNGEWGQWRKSATSKQFRHLGKGEHADPLLNLFENKLSPPMSFLNDLRRGEMFAGQKLTVANELRDRFSPLLWQDIYDAWRHGGVGVGIATAGFGTFGVGAQTFKSQKPKSSSAPSRPAKRPRGSSIYGGSRQGSNSIYKR